MQFLDIALADGRAAAAAKPSNARRGTAMTELHVVPDERTTWRVYESGVTAPLSEHVSATDAELAALARADDCDAERVVIHDRYHRTYDAAPTRGTARTRAARPRPP